MSPEGGGLPAELGGGARESAVVVEEAEGGAALTIEEVVNRLVQTASNRLEEARTAPATIITITHEELQARGYQELTDVLDDLPSIDMSRAWADTYFKTYWRGYRNAIGAPYLLMLDGVVYNHLWRNDTEIMAAFPLMNVDRIEVLYGPASSVYGPNAAMGVINVITRKDATTFGTHTRARLSIRAPQRSEGVGDLTKSADAHVLFKSDDFRISVAARADFGALDPGIGERFEYTKQRYYADPILWGDYVRFPEIAGQFRSPSEKQAVDARVFIGRTEMTDSEKKPPWPCIERRSVAVVERIEA